VMFPVFATAAARDPGAIRGACRSAQRYLLALAAPFILLVLGAADLLLGWWLGDEFRENSSAVARLLAVGILVNIVAQVPLTALNAAGRADVSAWIAACELPVYAVAAWFAATRFGVEGVAAIWAARALLDALALSVAAGRILPAETRAPAGQRRSTGAIAVLCAFLAGAWVAPYALADAPIRLATVAALGAGLVVWEWRALLGSDERENLRRLCSRLLTTPAR